MQKILKVEEIALFGLSIYLFHQTDFTWWWYPTLILIPDISMIGYLAGSKIGAYSYNLFHHKAFAIMVLTIGWFSGNEWIALSGIILFGHSSLDRVFGYGLKYIDSFQHTHLGWLKVEKKQKLT